MYRYTHTPKHTYTNITSLRRQNSTHQAKIQTLAHEGPYRRQLPILGTPRRLLGAPRQLRAQVLKLTRGPNAACSFFVCRLRARGCQLGSGHSSINLQEELHRSGALELLAFLRVEQSGGALVAWECTAVGSEKLEHACRMISADAPPSFGLGLDDINISTFWLLLCQHGSLLFCGRRRLIHMYVYMSICKYICTYTYTYTYECIYIHMYIYIYTNVYWHIYMYMYIHMRVRVFLVCLCSGV